MRLLITALIFLAVSIPAQAAHRHHHRHRSVQNHHAEHHRSVRRHRASRHSARHVTVESKRNRGEAARHRQPQGTVHHGGGMVSVDTAAGRITVASHLAERFKALIADFVAAGYKPRHIGCLAHGGHVPNSRHYAGAACDFDQRGWGDTVKFMYHATAIIKKHGFRDGCSFNDCGHVDDGLPLRHTQRWRDDDDG